MRASLVCIGRFHHFHLARQFEKRGLLEAIYTGYPRFKLADEPGIPRQKIHTFPWLLAPYMASGRIGLSRFAWLDRQMAWMAHEMLDRYVATQVKTPSLIIALSGSGLNLGRKMQNIGGVYACDRASSHIRYQDEILREEYKRYGIKWKGVDPRIIDKEEAEYHQANFVTVPSQFCYDSFLEKGIPPSKLKKIPFGSRLEWFYPDTNICRNNQEFNILFVGACGPRKGLIDLLEAFRRLKHPQKKLTIIGSISDEAKHILEANWQAGIVIHGIIPNAILIGYYSAASVFLLPSIEEGLAFVIGEAMACGCPVIATTNTGASELITNGAEGFIVPIRSPELIADRLQLLADEPELRERMGQAALARVQKLGGWDAYGEAWASVLNRIG